MNKRNLGIPAIRIDPAMHKEISEGFRNSLIVSLNFSLRNQI
jgi:hypothetical protein